MSYGKKTTIGINYSYYVTFFGAKRVFVPVYVAEELTSQEILVYIDPVTGQEKDILILLYTDGGVLTK